MNATHRARINNETVYVKVGHNQFSFCDSSEQCHDCGGDEYSLVGREKDSTLALHCHQCGTDHRLAQV